MKKDLQIIIKELTQKVEDFEYEYKENSEFSNLTNRQIHYLEAILQTGEPSLSELAEFMGLSKPTVTLAIDKLNNNGFLTKVQSTSDRRVLHIKLTKSGKQINRIHEHIHKKIAEYLTFNLTDTEIELLTLLLKKSMMHKQ